MSQPATLDRAFSLIRQLQGRWTETAAAHAGPSGSRTTASTTYVALTSGPSVTIATAGDWLVRFGLDIQVQVAAPGVNQANARVGINGTSDAGRTLFYIGQAQFDGASVFGETHLTLAAGDVLTVMIANANAVSTVFSNGTISAMRP